MASHDFRYLKGLFGKEVFPPAQLSGNQSSWISSTTTSVSSCDVISVNCHICVD